MLQSIVQMFAVQEAFRVVGQIGGRPEHTELREEVDVAVCVGDVEGVPLNVAVPVEVPVKVPVEVPVALPDAVLVCPTDGMGVPVAVPVEVREAVDVLDGVGLDEEVGVGVWEFDALGELEAEGNPVRFHRPLQVAPLRHVAEKLDQGLKGATVTCPVLFEAIRLG